MVQDQHNKFFLCSQKIKLNIKLFKYDKKIFYQNIYNFNAFVLRKDNKHNILFWKISLYTIFIMFFHQNFININEILYVTLNFINIYQKTLTT